MTEPMQYKLKRYLVICTYMFGIMWWLQEWLHSAGVLQFYSITIIMPSLGNNSIHHTSNLQVFIKTFPSQGTSTRIFWACSTRALFFFLFIFRSWVYTLVKMLMTLAEVFCCSSQPVQVNTRIEPHIWSHIHLSCWVIICHDLSTANKCLVNKHICYKFILWQCCCCKHECELMLGAVVFILICVF